MDVFDNRSMDGEYCGFDDGSSLKGPHWFQPYWRELSEEGIKMNDELDDS